MAFVEDISVDCVQDWTCDVGHVIDDGVEDEAEVLNSFFATIDVVSGCDTKKVVNIGLQLKLFRLVLLWLPSTMPLSFFATTLLQLKVKLCLKELPVPALVIAV